MTTPNDANDFEPAHTCRCEKCYGYRKERDALKAELELMRAVVEAAKEMRDLLHLRLRYCPEALWLEENYIKLKDALAALKRGGDK